MDNSIASSIKHLITICDTHTCNSVHSVQIPLSLGGRGRGVGAFVVGCKNGVWGIFAGRGGGVYTKQES